MLLKPFGLLQKVGKVSITFPDYYDPIPQDKTKPAVEWVVGQEVFDSFESFPETVTMQRTENDRLRLAKEIDAQTAEWFNKRLPTMIRRCSAEGHQQVEYYTVRRRAESCLCGLRGFEDWSDRCSCRKYEAEIFGEKLELVGESTTRLKLGEPVS